MHAWFKMFKQEHLGEYFIILYFKSSHKGFLGNLKTQDRFVAITCSDSFLTPLKQLTIT